MMKILKTKHENVALPLARLMIDSFIRAYDKAPAIIKVPNEEMFDRLFSEVDPDWWPATIEYRGRVEIELCENEENVWHAVTYTHSISNTKYVGLMESNEILVTAIENQRSEYLRPWLSKMLTTASILFERTHGKKPQEIRMPAIYYDIYNADFFDGIALEKIRGDRWTAHSSWDNEMHRTCSYEMNWNSETLLRKAKKNENHIKDSK